MSKLKIYGLYQNNSGGTFDYPSEYVFVLAENEDGARELASNHISFCGETGLYADYDDCGCCPCCGHRWDACFEKWIPSDFWVKDRITWLGGISYSLITKDGIVIADTIEKLNQIRLEIKKAQEAL